MLTLMASLMTPSVFSAWHATVIAASRSPVSRLSVDTPPPCSAPWAGAPSTVHLMAGAGCPPRTAQL